MHRVPFARESISSCQHQAPLRRCRVHAAVTVAIFYSSNMSLNARFVYYIQDLATLPNQLVRLDLCAI